jgi:prepilin-type N-terminal cleavage/methylation domain-containing protein
MKAFTLIETLVVIAIFSLAIGAIFGLVGWLYTIHDYTFQQSRAIDEARRGVETMIRELREARPGDEGSYMLKIAEDFQIVFYSDIDGDNKTEMVRYFVEDNNLEKGIIEPSGWPTEYNPADEKISILSNYVRNSPPIFRYFDGQGVELPSPSRLKDTKMMRVYLVVNVDPSRPPKDYNLESTVQIRNLKENL